LTMLIVLLRFPRGITRGRELSADALFFFRRLPEKGPA
jgi:hypothetical protein